ncbi:MAG: hypothetical protein LBK95_21150, partial [Bifidobacteriaceae bacterium]|nr:hypothetical protein [Bifidobacteriaceae bacterium]
MNLGAADNTPTHRSIREGGAKRRPAGGAPARHVRGGRRQRGWLKIVALTAAAAVGLAGSVLVDSLTGSAPSEAVTFINSWNGVFGKNQLWSKAAGTWYYELDDANPGSAGSIGTISKDNLLGKFQSNGTDQGASGGATDVTIAAGPVFKASGDDAIHMVGGTATAVVNGPAAGQTYVYRSVLENGVRKVNGLNYGAITTTATTATNGADLATCRAGTRYAADVNQKTGYLYELAASDALKLSPGTTSWSVTGGIYKLGTPGTAEPKFSCLASASYVAAAGGESLNEQWVALGAGTAPDVNSWTFSSDITTDAAGNIYLLARANDTRYALVRIEVPQGANGLPTSSASGSPSPWTLRVVKAFLVPTSSPVEIEQINGLAYVDGSFYSVAPGGIFHRWNALTGTVASVSAAGVTGAGQDLAAAQAVPVIEGTVYDDQNGDGVIQSGEPAAPGMTLDIFKNTAAEGAEPVWTKRGSVLTDSQGRYVAVLDAPTGQFLVRLVQPKLGPTATAAAAVQTYATSQASTFDTGAGTLTNTARPYCSQGKDADYRLVEPSSDAGVACNGARWDGVDPTNLNANPLAASGGAATVTRVDLTTDAAAVKADFGVSIAFSWGDTLGYTSTLDDGGPYANPRRAGQNYLWLGYNAGRFDPEHADGTSNEYANTHNTDDGLWYSRTDANNNSVDEWLMLQNQLLAAGQTYVFRANARGSEEALDKATVKAWITSLVGGTRASTFDTNLLGFGGCAPKPDASGYVYCKYTAPSATNLPSNGVGKVFIRSRISQDAGVTPTSRGTTSANTQPWVPNGEIEDYGMAVTRNALRVQVRTRGGVAANARLGLTNTRATDTNWPSSDTDTRGTDAGGDFVISRTAHALVSNTAQTVLTTTGVGSTTSTAMNGWNLSGLAAETWCENSKTGAKLNATVNPASRTVTLPQRTGSDTLPAEITCFLTYLPTPAASASTVTAEPSANSAAPVAAPAGTSAVTVSVVGRVANADGNTVNAVTEGAEVKLALTPIQGSGATAPGARLEYSDDGGTTWTSAGQSYTCVTNASGGCSKPVRVAASVPGGYDLKAQIGTDYLKNAATDATTDGSPVKIYFKAGAGADSKSSMKITKDAGQAANHNDPSRPDGPWGKQTITVTLLDDAGAAFDGGTDSGMLAVSPAGGGPEGLYYSNGGQFVCAATGAVGPCPAGVYSLEVYSSKAGSKDIQVTHNPPQGTAFKVKEEGTGAAFVTAQFTAPPADAASSVFVFTVQGEAIPDDDWDDPSDQPDGVGVPQQVGDSFHPGIRVWDAGRNNPVGDVSVRFTVDQNCSAVFAGNESAADPKVFETVTSPTGKAQAVLRSETAQSCQLTGEIEAGGTWTETPARDGNPRTMTAEWVDGAVDLDASSFTVSTEPVEANGSSVGEVTATLVDSSGLPITTAETQLVGFGPTAAGVQVSAFKHDAGGVYHASFTGTQAGDKEITVQVPGGTLSLLTGGNRFAHLVAGAPAAANSWLVQPTGKVAANGSSKIAVKVRAFDAKGNPAAKGTVRFQLPDGVAAADGTTGPGPFEADVDSGWATVELSATVKGAYTVTASTGDPVAQIKAVKNAAGEMVNEDGTVRVEFTAGNPSPDTSPLTIPTTGVSGAETMKVGGEKHRAEVTVKDAAGNTLEAGDASVVFAYSYKDVDGVLQSGESQPVAIGADGVAAWEFSSDSATVWTITARIVGTGKDVKDSPQQAGFRAGDLDVTATLASFEVDTGTIAADGIARAFAKMKAQDRFGNPVSKANLGFSLDYAVDQGGPLFGHAETGSRQAAGE